MTDNKTPPDTKLPPFKAHVTAVDSITTAHLKAVLSEFAEGSINPLILGSNNQPEAALVPFGALVRLMRYDQAAYARAQQDLHDLVTERVASNTDTPAETFTSVDEFAASLGKLGQQWVTQRNTNPDAATDPKTPS